MTETPGPEDASARASRTRFIASLTHPHALWMLAQWAGGDPEGFDKARADFERQRRGGRDDPVRMPVVASPEEREKWKPEIRHG